MYSSLHLVVYQNGTFAVGRSLYIKMCDGRIKSCCKLERFSVVVICLCNEVDLNSGS